MVDNPTRFISLIANYYVYPRSETVNIDCTLKSTRQPRKHNEAPIPPTETLTQWV